MRRPVRTVLLIGALVAAVLLGGAAKSVSGAETGEVPARAGAQVQSFDGFPLYWLGESFEGLPLTATTRRNDPPDTAQRVHANYVSFIYGDCAAADESGCAPPLEVQVWPACERSLADYALTPAGEPVPHLATVVRGVPAAYFENGLRLELYTGTVTVVVFGLDPGRLARAAAALRAANALASTRPVLPPPAVGATTGTLGCSG